MRFMMLMIPQGYETAGPDVMPDTDAMAAMLKYNKALQQAGVLVDLNGLYPPAAGARVTFAGGKPLVTDGPFPETKETLGGYWLLDVESRDAAIEWARRCPAADNGTIEIRRIHELDDFPPDVQEAAAGLAGIQSP